MINIELTSMSVVGGQLGDLAEVEPTECVRTGLPVCSTDRDISMMKRFIIVSGKKDVPSDKELIVAIVKELLDVAKEADIYETPAYRNFIGSTAAERTLSNEFKAKGPANTTALLDNFNIDNTLARWAKVSKDEFGKKFYHVPFQMIDFAKMGTQLSKVDPLALKRDGNDCLACVINTDVSTGRGIHWFCIYVDLAHAGTVEDPIQLEYFNSSGYSPRQEIQTWLEQVSMNLLKQGIRSEIIHATGGKQIQYSKTECGVWSLVYIKSRLTNHPFHWIANVGANDMDIIEYRQQIFRV